MIYLMIELGGFDVLKKIKNAYSKKMIIEIKKTLKEKKLSRCYEEDNYFLFTFYHEFNYIQDFIVLVTDLEKLFQYEKKFFQGNILYIGTSEKTDSKKIFENSKKNIVKLPFNKGTFYSEHFKEKYCDYFKSFKSNTIPIPIYGMSISQKRELISNMILYSRLTVGSIFSKKKIDSILNKNIFSQPLFSNLTFELSSIYSSPLDEFSIDKIYNKLGFQAIEINSLFSSHLYFSLLNELPTNLQPQIEYFIQHGAGEYRLPAILLLIKTVCLNYDLELVNDLESKLISSDNKNESPVSLELTQILVHFYQALTCSDYEMVVQLQNELMQQEESPSIFLEYEKKLALADSQLALRYSNDALSPAKEVLSQLLTRNNPKWFSVHSNFIIANAMLQKAKVAEAEVYFEFARDNAKKINLDSIMILSSVAIAFINYLRGKLDVAQECLQELNLLFIKKSKKNLSPLFRIYVEFLSGRLYFEEGEYGEAEKVFRKLIKRATESGYSAGIETFRSWESRSSIFGGRKNKGLAQLSDLRPSVEKLIFAAEGYIFNGNYKKALELLNESKTYIDSLSRFISPYINLFQNGYQNYEERALNYKNDQSAFSFYVEGLRVFAKAGLGDSSLISYYKKKLRTELRPHGDPSSRIYCYLLAAASYMIKPSTIELDQLTMINRSFKYLQEYSGLTRNPVIRMNYLKNNLWNKKIYAMARLFKIVEPERVDTL